MKGFLKESSGFLATVLLALAMLAILQFVSCEKSNDLAQVLESVGDLKVKLVDVHRERAGFEGVEDNLELARKDNAMLLEERIKELKKWKEILGRENLFSTVVSKDSDDVNAEISRFLDRFRKEAEDRKVRIRGGADFRVGATDIFPGGGIPEVKDREGFGFSGYDGAWPSISDGEARELLKQKLILEKLLSALFKARPEGEPMEILGVRREVVGQVDRQEAEGEALAVEPLAQTLAKREGRIDTYAFEVRFEARTHALRTFINTLKHPFLVRDIKVRRVGSTEAGFSGGSSPSFDLPFGNGNGDAVSSSLPIIVDVGSRFVVLVEYVLAVHADPKTFLQRHYPKTPPPEAMMEDFLKASGSKEPSKVLFGKLYPKQEESPMP